MSRYLLLLGTVALASCSAEDGTQPLTATVSLPVSVPVPAPTPTPTSTPSPSPTPTPSATPAPVGSLDDGVTIIVAEGDSITSPTSPKYYAGAFAAAHPDITFKNSAVGGSGLKNLLDRRDADMALRPDILTVFIGANDFGSDAQAYADRVFAYVEPFRAMGTKVYIGTILPSDVPNAVTRDIERRKYAQIMDDAVGRRIDGVFDFGRTPIIGDDGAAVNRQLYADYVHPTVRDYNGGIGGHDYLYGIYSKVVSEALKSLAP